LTELTCSAEHCQSGQATTTTCTRNNHGLAILEFAVSSQALLRAAQQYDPQYLTREPQAREFFAWNARRAMALVARGRDLPPFKWGELAVLETALRSAPEVEPLRASARSVFGATWTREVLGF